MKLDKLDEPYNKDYIAGYIVINRENRRTLILKALDGTLHSTQYARYLMACSIGRYLTAEETVDHVDNDKTNDALTNLAILSRAENSRKSAKKREHGHSAMIRSGCKCHLCRATKKEWNARYEAKRQQNKLNMANTR